jgi:hypothetical protein
LALLPAGDPDPKASVWRKIGVIQAKRLTRRPNGSGQLMLPNDSGLLWGRFKRIQPAISLQYR